MPVVSSIQYRKQAFNLFIKPLLISVFLIFICSQAANSQTLSTLFSDDFANGLTQFSSDGSVSTGSYGVRLRGSGSSDGMITSQSFSTLGFTNISLRYDRTTAGLDSGESATASYSVNGGPFTVLESIGVTSGEITLNLGANAANQSQVRLRFAIDASSYFERYDIASLEVTGIGEGGSGDHGLTSRQDPNVTIPVEGGGGNVGDPILEDAFTNLPNRAGANAFEQPVFFAGVPGSNKNIVLEQEGRIVIFENDDNVSSSSVFLDITDRVGRESFYSVEQGLLGCAFDPNYPTNRYFYCYYTRSGDGDGVLSRFQTSAANPDVANANSEVELIVIPQPGSTHNGGMVAFNPIDGYLYLSLGDGGCCDDPHGGSTGTSQDLTRLLGSIIRIAPETDTNGGYQIPATNPFGQNRCPQGESTSSQACGEIFNYGFRNPWRFSFNPATGDAWVGDVGQDAREEVDLWLSGESGINYGWSCREGFIEGPKPNTASCNSPSEQRDPILDFVTGPNEAVIGGYVYRGNAVPQLQGQYIYGRIGAREIHVSDANGNGNLLFSTGSQSVYSFGEDNSGELYAVYAGGNLARFATEGGSGGGEVPTLLSQTGIYSDVPNLTPATGFVPYDLKAQLFSDNLEKTRLFAIPLNGNITFSDTGRWQFPVGSVVIKNFFYLGEPVETRALVRGSDQWRGYVYEWNSNKTDATLVDAAGDTISLPGGVLYDLPSQANCQACHNTGDGSEGQAQIIGLQARQQNKDFLYPSTDIVDNQLRALNHVGFFTSDIGSADNYDSFPDYNDDSVSLEERAKSYLNVNCGNCHRPGGGPPVPILLEYDVPDALRNIFGVPASQGNVNGAQYVVDPGNKENSVLWQRMRLTLPDDRAMPPLAHRQLDTAGIALIGDWIDSLEEVEPSGDQAITGFYLEGGASATTPDQFSFTNTGDINITALLVDLGSASGAPVFDSADVPFAVTSNDGVGFSGNFNLSNGNTVLQLNFTGFAPNETFSFNIDLDDAAGGFTPGAEVAGTTLRVSAMNVNDALGLYEVDNNDNNRANIDVGDVTPPTGNTAATGFYLETGGGATTPDNFSFTNTGDDTITRIVFDLSTSSGGAVFDPVGVPFALSGANAVGFDGNFSVNANQAQLTVNFSNFTPGQSFNFTGDLDDTGGYTTGAEVSGATITVTGGDVVSGTYQEASGNGDRADVVTN